MKRVEWRSKITGKTGHGNWIPADHAEYAAREANKNFSELEHWTVTK